MSFSFLISCPVGQSAPEIHEGDNTSSECSFAVFSTLLFGSILLSIPPQMTCIKSTRVFGKPAAHGALL